MVFTSYEIYLLREKKEWADTPSYDRLNVELVFV